MASFLSSTAALPTPLPKPQFTTCSSPSRPPPPPPPPPPPKSPAQPPLSVSPINPPRPKPAPAESTDWIASALTRRFGLGAGVAWAAFLAAGVVSEQIKTRIEASHQESNTRDVESPEEIALPNGIRYSDLRIGGGAAPRSGDLVVIHLKGRVVAGGRDGRGEVFVDTFRDEKRALALVMGSRPYTRGMCEGVEYVLQSMRAGGKRRVVVPPELGFGDSGADFGGGMRIPPAAPLEFVVQVEEGNFITTVKLARVWPDKKEDYSIQSMIWRVSGRHNNVKRQPRHLHAPAPLPVPAPAPPFLAPTTKAGFAALLRSHSHPNHLKQIHALILTTGLSIKNSLLTQILQSLSLSGDMLYARNLFEEMPKRRVFLWNTLMRGYVRSDLCSEALAMYNTMRKLSVRPDEFTFPFVLKACTALLDVWLGMEVHALVVKLGLDINIIVSTELVVMYVNFGDPEKADYVFERMGNDRDLVSWNAIIAAYSQSGQADRALAHFKRMESTGVGLDTTTMACVLSSCASLGCLEFGKMLHFKIKGAFFPSNIFVENAILDMYAKCGSMEDACRLFDEMRSRNVVSWSAIIGGYAINGDSQGALAMFSRMRDEGVKPNDVTMLAVLSACSHGGLVRQGKELFCSVARPTVQHCATMVDLLGRSGNLQEAYGFIQSMPMAPDAGVWGALLSACTVRRNTELGKIAAAELLNLAPEIPSYQVQLSNMYAAMGRWSEVEKIRELMKSSNLRKVGGYSSVELDGDVHVFYEGSRPQSMEIYEILRELTSTVSGRGYRPESSAALHDVEEEEKEAALMVHSERLAIAFSIVHCKSFEYPIRIMKNIRICYDCHEFCKHVSKALERVMIVRDKSRFHHFRDGLCSCRDYW